MPIITISRGSYSHGKEIAESISESLGWTCLSREILLDASRHFNTSEKKLLQSIHDAPTFLERLMHGRDKYLLSIRAALLERAAEDNLIYCGHAGHLLIPELQNVLKVRIIADMEERVSLMRRTLNISKDEARVFLEKEDKERQLWTRYLYKVDIEDPRLYDIIFHIKTLSIEDATRTICNAVKSPSFQTTPELLENIRDMALSTHIEASIREICKAAVTVKNRKVHIRVPKEKIKKTGFASAKVQRQVQEQIQVDTAKRIMDLVNNLAEIKAIDCDVETPFYS